mmetsp:Transcript_28908/g.37986  ORF Transcript_28908/g.37986 Transcript_28908/m.37986 type:complete len:169 (-) Transcript_28908:314-820(-)
MEPPQIPIFSQNFVPCSMISLPDGYHAYEKQVSNSDSLNTMGVAPSLNTMNAAPANTIESDITMMNSQLENMLISCRSCSTCQSGVWGQCRYCDLPLCSGCTRQCDSCAHAFCSVCLSATYSTRYDHEVHLCPGCLQNDGISISHPHPQMADAPQSAGQQEDVSMMML